MNAAYQPVLLEPNGPSRSSIKCPCCGDANGLHVSTLPPKPVSGEHEGFELVFWCEFCPAAEFRLHIWNYKGTVQQAWADGHRA